MGDARAPPTGLRTAPGNLARIKKKTEPKNTRIGGIDRESVNPRIFVTLESSKMKRASG